MKEPPEIPPRKTVWLSPAELAALLAEATGSGADYVKISWANAQIWHDIDYSVRLPDGKWTAETRLPTPAIDMENL